MPFAKNIDKNIGKNITTNLSGKYNKKNFLIMLNNLQQINLKIIQAKIQKMKEATGDLAGDKLLIKL